MNRRLTDHDRIEIKRLREQMLQREPDSVECMALLAAVAVILARGKVADRHMPTWFLAEAKRWELRAQELEKLVRSLDT